MNDDTFISQDSFDSNPDGLPEINNSLIQNNPFALLGYRVNQRSNDASNIFSLPGGRTHLDAGEDQLFVVNELPPNSIYRGRTIDSTRTNSSTASSLSPMNKIPQDPVNMLVMLPSTKCTVSGGEMLDDSSEDEADMNEHPRKARNTMKFSKNVADVDEEEIYANERENNVEAM